MEKEEWKEVVAYTELLSVSNFGRVKNKENKLIKLDSVTGYPRVRFRKNGIVFRKLVHRYIAESFIPNPENKPYVNHINGIKHDNRVENLEWVTASENTVHAIKTGLMKGSEGTKNPKSKLSEEEVLKIRIMYKTGKYSYLDISKLFGITLANVGYVVLQKTWKHI
jgi:hypothetical protein